MNAPLLSHLLVGTLLAAELSPASGLAQKSGSKGRAWASEAGGQSRPGVGTRPGYQHGYLEGYREGERDARQHRGYDLRRHAAYKDGDRGYNINQGDRDRYREEFRRGFETGYRSGFQRVRSLVGSRRGGLSEPAYARGYADGFEKGREDWQDRDRYDPVRHGDYRNGEKGYSDHYGSRDAYKRYYREGFREGYEAGYRGGSGGRPR